MQIKFLGTGSSGNAIVIQTDSTTIMIDCGIAPTKIEKKLLENGVNPADIDAIFLTHAHGDHVKGLPMAEKWRIPVYASEGTFKTLNFNKELSFTFSADDWLTFGYMKVDNFRTHHNDYDAFGYVVSNGHDKISICLDTGIVDDDMIDAMRGSTHLIMESNHDVDMVELSSYPDSVKARNLSDLGHLSNEQTAEALSKLITGNGEHIYLAHLSSKCNTPFVARMIVRNALLKKGFKVDEHYFMEVV